MIDTQVDILRQCAALSTATARRLQDSIVYMDGGAAEASYASFGTKLQQGWEQFCRSLAGLCRAL